MSNLDNGYVSDYLIHWTGKDKGYDNLLSILTENRLRFGANVFARLGLSTVTAEVQDKMICFTDVPICYSHDHCMKYGKFGIAFEKQYLARMGAQPVFYCTPSTERDVNKVIKFTIEPGDATIPQDVMKALRRLLYFSQPYCKDYKNGKAYSSPESSYYEREWRLGRSKFDENYGKDGVKSKRYAAGDPLPSGKIIKDKEHWYFPFNESDISFVVLPRDKAADLRGALPSRQLQILCYENLKDGMERGNTNIGTFRVVSES